MTTDLIGPRKQIVFITILVFGIGVALLLFFTVVVRKVVKNTFKPLEESVALAAGDIKFDSFLMERAPEEITPLLLKIESLVEFKIHNESNIKMSELAIQVAHDIRSPLSVLRMIEPTLESVRPEIRDALKISIKRISDIAVDLGKSHKANVSQSKPLLIARVVLEIVNEKQVEFSHRKDVSISTEFGKETEGLFGQIPEADIKRVLSNILNNAFESIELKGSIKISVQLHKGVAQVVVADNGCGIPEHIISQLGKRGITYGKSDGSGLGISNAVTVLSSHGGSIQFESTKSLGTKVTISLPAMYAPGWSEAAVAENVGEHDFGGNRARKLSCENRIGSQSSEGI